MDQSTLVEGQIEEGRSVLEQLTRAGFDVTAALWMKEEGQWRFLIATSEIDRRGLREAYGIIYDLFSKSQDLRWLTIFDFNLIPPGDPIAKDVLDILHRYPARIATHYSGAKHGNVSIEGAYLYEPIPSAHTP
jgi:hypothetical protein